MSTSPSFLTTEQLIDSCERQGVRVSTTQLGRWVRAGLIPASLRKRHGRGRGLGAEWHWEAECLSRAVLIAQTLATGDPSLQRAAYVLAATGYAPDAECLRQVLLDRLAAFERFLTKRQLYLTDSHPVAEKRRRLTRNMRRKLADMPEDLFQRFAAYMSSVFGLVSPEEQHVPPVLHRIQALISIPAMRQRLEAAEGVWLLAKYEEASRGLPKLATLLLAGLNLLLPFLARWVQQRKPEQRFPIGIDAEMLLAGMREEADRVLVAPENPLGEVRLYYTTLLAAIAAEEEEMLPEWAMFLGETFVGLTSYLNLPPKQAAALGLLGPHKDLFPDKQS